MEAIKLGAIKNLKELSWYLTLPLLTSAMVLQNISDAPSNSHDKFQLAFDWFLFVGNNFTIIAIILAIFFIFYFVAGGWLEGIHNIPFTLILSTTILSFSGVGLMLHTVKPEGIEISINIIWFLGFTALSFNLYQLDSNKEEHNKSQK